MIKVADLQPDTAVSLEEMLWSLQVSQRDHDEAFHKEIVRLSAKDRLNHISLHFAKYGCRLQFDWENKELRNKNIIDSFIMALSGLSMLNCRVYDLWLGGEVALDESSIINRIEANSLNNKNEFISIYSRSIVEAIVASERLDHIEHCDFRESFIRSFSSVGVLCYVYIHRHIGAVQPIVESRLLSVKKKSIFFRG